MTDEQLAYHAAYMPTNAEIETMFRDNWTNDRIRLLIFRKVQAEHIYPRKDGREDWDCWKCGQRHKLYLVTRQERYKHDLVSVDIKCRNKNTYMGTLEGTLLKSCIDLLFYLLILHNFRTFIDPNIMLKSEKRTEMGYHMRAFSGYSAGQKPKIAVLAEIAAYEKSLQR